MRNLTPADLGLPTKFKDFRPHQVEALERILASKKKVVLVQAPTGIGKTVIMAALAKCLKKPMLYTCLTKQLQGQVVADFPYAVELKGRSNYRCLKHPRDFPNVTAQECTVEVGNSSRRACRACDYFKDCTAATFDEPVGQCSCATRCPYMVQKHLAMEAELAVLNTPFFLAEANFAGGFSGWPWVTLDEGDSTEAALMNFIEVSLTARQIEMLRLEPPAKKTVASAWLEWAEQHAIPTIESRLEEPAADVLPRDLRDRAEMEKLLRELRFLTSQRLEYWVFIPEEKSWTFKPVFVRPYADHYLWQHGDRFLVMSATIISRHQFARDLGLEPDDVDFIDLPSPFPPDRCPVHYIPAADMTHRNKERAWPQMVRALDEVLARHPSEKGLIHTHSYALARYVFDHSRHRHRLMQHDSDHRISALETFKATNEPAVLISPSMDRGTNLPYDQCRFSVVPKVPFPNLGDKQVAQRLHSAHDGQEWYVIQTIRSLVQATGRDMRVDDDYSTSYILDKQFGGLYYRHHSLFPIWWRRRVIPLGNTRLAQKGMKRHE